MKRAAILWAVLIGVWAGLAAGATLTVPDQYPTITEALAAAQPGDEIVVNSGYVGDAETFPILVQKDNITIRVADGESVIVTGRESHAVFVVGAYRTYNEETHEFEVHRVSGVTIRGFTIGDLEDAVQEDVAVVVKNADRVTIEDLVITGTLEGIRLINASGCTLQGNSISMVGELVDADNDGIFDYGRGIGIFLEQSTANHLRDNQVELSGLGLFMFESSGNDVSGDTYEANAFGGVVLNDTESNTLDDITAIDNGGWGVRFVFADGDALTNSTVTGNFPGGVELLASQGCTVEGNLVHSNGYVGDDVDDVQILVAPGDKALLETSVFETLNTLTDEAGDPITVMLSEFVREKLELIDKLRLLTFWLDDLEEEVEEVYQQVLGGNTSGAQALLRAILRNIPSDYGPITRDDVQTGSVDLSQSSLGDPSKNFTYEGAAASFDGQWGDVTVAKLDFYEDGVLDDFGLDRDGGDNTAGNDDDEISWDKLWLIDIILLALKGEIENSYVYAWNHLLGIVITEPTAVQKLDSLREKIESWHGLGLITDDAYNDLIFKLTAVETLVDKLITLKDDNYTGDTDSIFDWLVYMWNNLSDAMAVEEARNEIRAILGDMREEIGHITEKLCYLDLELPPFPQVNGLPLVGKKEKPFSEITTGELSGLTSRVESHLEDDSTADAIAEGLGYPTSGTFAGTVEADHKRLTDSEGNLIASNLITSDLMNIDARNVGIVIASPHNTVANNLITNERVPPLDPEPAYGEYHRLDVAMILLADECILAYNAIEWVNNGIIRGGDWEFRDYQLEYVFAKLATISYWPGPGEVLSQTHNVYVFDHYDDSGREVWTWEPETQSVAPGDNYYPPAGVVDYACILSIEDPATITVAFDDRVVKFNRLALNFFDHTGTGIDIYAAESNYIYMNLFYYCANGGIIFRDTGLVGTNIQMEYNDHFGGICIYNHDVNLPVTAANNYTPPEGEFGHAPCFGRVNPPQAPQPFAYTNFGTAANFASLGIGKYFQDGGLPPNLEYLYPGVDLPDGEDEKPRDPADIFGPGQGEGPQTLTHLFPQGWNMVSVPLVPAAPADPVSVFGDDLSGMPLFIFEYDPAIPGYQVPHGDLAPEVGYWVYFYDDTLVDVSGTVCAENIQVPLGPAGWHMFSTCTTAVLWDAVRFRSGTDEKTLAEAATAGWLVPIAYHYDPTTGQYEQLMPGEMRLIEPWLGYWVYTNVADLVMILPIGEPMPPSPPTSLTIPASALPMDLEPPAPPALPMGAEGLLVRNVPNPVRDVHTTTFQVLAAGVERMRVSVYDLTGKLVWQGEAAGSELVWHTDDLTGAFLANGVYLYRVEAKIAGQWVATGLLKLVIVR